MKNIYILSVIVLVSLFSVTLPYKAEARGRTGSFRVGGYTSHGKGSHYIGGYVRSGPALKLRLNR